MQVVIFIALLIKIISKILIIYNFTVILWVFHLQVKIYYSKTTL